MLIRQRDSYALLITGLSVSSEGREAMSVEASCTMQRKNNSIRERGQERQGEGG